MSAKDFSALLPEWVLVGTILVMFLADFFARPERKAAVRLYSGLAVVGLLGGLWAVLHGIGLEPAKVFFDMVAVDPMALFFKGLFVVAALLTVIFCQRARELEAADTPSFYTLFIALVLGMMFLANSVNLLMIYLSLEMVSVLSYLLTGSLKGSRRSAEASLKYVIYGGAASGIMVYGISLLFGLTGSLELSAIAQHLANYPANRAVLFVSVLLITAGYAFKVSAFPFHMWAPDVYEGAPTPVTAFFSVGPKAAGFAALIRFFLIALTVKEGTVFLDLKSAGWPHALALLSVATMTVGNLVAIWQNNMKRFLAYSSIAQAGYMLMGFAALNQEGVQAVLFYLVVYLVMNLGAFLVVLIVAERFGAESMESYKGLGRRGGFGTVLALAMTVFMLSLTGLPPFAGFIGKLYLFSAVMKAQLYWLALAGVLNSVVSLYYYVRVVKAMFFDAPPDEARMPVPALRYAGLVTALAVLTLYFGLFWNGLANLTQQSTRMLF